MNAMVRVECCDCGGKYFVENTSMNPPISADARSRDAFPFKCPHCEDGHYAFSYKRMGNCL